MTDEKNPFREAGRLLNALRRLDAWEKERIQAIRDEGSSKRGDTMNAFSKVAQQMVLAQRQREMSETQPAGELDAEE